MLLSVGQAASLHVIAAVRRRTLQAGHLVAVGDIEEGAEDNVLGVGEQHLCLILRAGRAERSPRVNHALVHHVHLEAWHGFE